MKRIFFLYLVWVALLTVPSFGRAEDPWGILQDSIDEDSFGVDKLLRHETIYYAVADDITPQEEEIFTNALRKWPADTLKAIKNAGREEEFKDIVNLLQRDLVLKKTDMTNGEVTLAIDPTGEICGKDASGCFADSHQVIVWQKFRHRFDEVVTHEVGHFYGLGDQYERARYNSSSTYSSNVNTQEGSIMRNSFASKGQLTCDDYDGFINLIDLRLSQKNGSFSARSRKGWRSLCPKTKNFYKEAKTVNRQPDEVSVLDHDSESGVIRNIEYDQKGNAAKTEYWVSVAKQLLPLFRVHKNDQITRDDWGRITSITSTRGSSLCPTQKGKSVRTFKYFQSMKDAYEIRVTCDTKHTSYTLPLLDTPNWNIDYDVPASGKARQVYEEFPITRPYTVSIWIENNHIHQISTWNRSVAFTDKGAEARAVKLDKNDFDALGFQATVEGRQKAKYRLSEQDFKDQLAHVKMPQSHRLVLLEAKDAHDKVFPYILGFYVHFYKPFLGSSDVQQTQQQVKSRLGNQRAK